MMNSSRNDDSLKNLLHNLKNVNINLNENEKSKFRSDSTCSAFSNASKLSHSTKNEIIKTEKKSIQNMIKSHPLLVDLNGSKLKSKNDNEDSDFGKKIDSDEDDVAHQDFDDETEQEIFTQPKINNNNNNNENCFNYTYNDNFSYKKMMSKSSKKPKQNPCTKETRSVSPCKQYQDTDNSCPDNIKRKFNRANRVFYNGNSNKTDNKCYESLPQYNEHASDLLNFLKCLWSEKKMCDLSIIVCGRKYPAHKLGLAMFSRKYRDEFQRKGNETPMYTITLKYSSVYAVEAILNYIYTAKIDINPSNVEEINCAAKELGIDELITMTNDYLSSLSIGDVLDYMGNIINKEGSELMFYELYVYFMTHLDKISRTPEFLKSSVAVVNALLGDSHLSVCKELEVFEACVRWLEYDRQNRQKCFPDLLKNVRFTLICPDDLVGKVENSSSVNLSDGSVYKQIYNAYKFHALNMSKLNGLTKKEECRNECLKGASVPDSFVKAIRELSEIAHKLKVARTYTSNKILD